jgi:hypothetical protein
MIGARWTIIKASVLTTTPPPGSRPSLKKQITAAGHVLAE